MRKKARARKRTDSKLRGAVKNGTDFQPVRTGTLRQGEENQSTSRRMRPFSRTENPCHFLTRSPDLLSLRPRTRHPSHMIVRQLAGQTPFTTKDGSTIRSI